MATKCLKESLKKGHKVIVYCLLGRNRSPSVIINYLITEHKMTLLDAYLMVAKYTSLSIQIENGIVLYNTALENEMSPIPASKISIDCTYIGNTSWTWNIGGYDFIT